MCLQTNEKIGSQSENAKNPNNTHKHRHSCTLISIFSFYYILVQIFFCFSFFSANVCRRANSSVIGQTAYSFMNSVLKFFTHFRCSFDMNGGNPIVISNAYRLKTDETTFATLFVERIKNSELSTI